MPTTTPRPTPTSRTNVRRRPVHRCQDCGASSAVWAGRCPGCGAWNTLVEERPAPAARRTASPDRPAVPIADVPEVDAAPQATRVSELDRVLGGGLVPGSVTLLGGEPGIGKSTLLLQAAAAAASASAPVLYVTGEESAAQVRRRAARLDAVADHLWLAAETELPAVIGLLEQVQPAVAVVDSIQTVFDPELSSAPGSVAQVRECAHRLVVEARRRGIAVVLVGHVTKDGGLAGPRVLEHLVDTVLGFEGDRHHALRLLRAVKHRHGSTGELGVFEMAGDGLRPVDDPSALFLADRRADAPGSVVVPILEAGRPLLVEVQALIARSTIPTPRRQAQGLDGGRLGMLLAVLAQRAGVSVADHDVWVTVAGGVRAVEPAVDLGVALAVVSAVLGRPVPSDLVVCGEVGLAGELRQVARTEHRLHEAVRLGFRRVLVPSTAAVPEQGCRAMRVPGLREAITAAGLA